MKYCPECKIELKGDPPNCPLCEATVIDRDGEVEPNPYPEIPLRFRRERIFRYLIGFSLLIILSYILAELFFDLSVGFVEYLLFAVVSLWVSMLILIRKRRNIAKSIVYLLVTFSLLSLYLDAIQGWSGWSLTYAIPSISISALLAMQISVRMVRMEIGDYILYIQLAALLGIIPGVFLLFNWTSSPVFSLFSFGLSSVFFLGMLIRHRYAIRLELKKRLDA
ncbi:DUF6320 domain-containing protein [Lacticigenium naphthae]|uniref:DUF6320 domain-containing protein n=1 Tax=Lacticigenium naphthae TaxID=515351 RepID=UPI00040988B5|nr:DUF6320 domain-containing protein [Lacticigenium naphthae]